MTTDRLDMMIHTLERQIAQLKEERKELNKRINQNKQTIAEIQNRLRKLKEERRNLK